MVMVDTAVSFLHKELSPNIIAQHFGIGMMVRNVLRRSDVQYDDVWLDDNWFEILHEVLKRS